MGRPINPYVAGAPLRGKRGFFGRQDTLDWVAQELRNPATNALVLFGQRRIGKTSLLLQLQRILPANSFLPIYFDLQDQAARPLGQVLADLADTVAERTDLQSPAPESFDDRGHFFRRTFLPQLYMALGENCRPIFLLDEFDVLEQVAQEGLPRMAANTFFPFLRDVMARDPRPAFVFVLGRRAEDLSLDFNATFKASLVREVWVLGREDAESLVRQAEVNGTLCFTDQAVDRILSLTNCHPYLTQLLCQRVWERAYTVDSTLPPRIDVAGVEAAVPDALEAGDQALVWLWNGLSAAEKIYAAALAETSNEGETISEELVIRVLAAHAARLRTRKVELAPQYLVRRRVVEEIGERKYRFAVELFRRWVHQHKPLSEVKDELDQLEPVASRLYEIGRGFFTLQQWESSIRYFRDALEANPRHFRAQLYLGEALLELGQIDRAIGELEQAYELDREEARLPLDRALIAQAKAQEEARGEDDALRRTPFTVPGWVSVLLAFMLMGILASFLWYTAERAFVAPYYEYKFLGPVSLAPAVQNVQAQVEYPRRISPGDRGIEHGKRIIVSVAKMAAGPAEPVYLAVKPMSGHVRFLTEDGHDTNGQLVISATYGIANLGSLYIEYPNVPPGGTIFLTVQVLPPTGAITQPMSIQGSDFAVEEESLVAGTIRRAVSLIPWQTFLVTLLALPGALLKELWDRNRKIPDLYRKMQQAWEEWHIDDIRGLYQEYQGMRFYVSLRGMVIGVAGHIGIESLYRQAEARFHFERARNALQRKASREAKQHLAKALEWDPIYEKVRALDERTRSLEEAYRYRKTRAPAVWWLDPMPDLKALPMLIALLEDRDRTRAEVRRRIVNILGHISDKDANRAVHKAFREDNDLSVQAQAAWMLARMPRPEKAKDRELGVAGPGWVKGWLNALPSPLVYNPFRAITAEDDNFLERHFFEHPIYRQLVDYGYQHVALFADPGCGKTSCRRMLKASLKSQSHLVIEYTSFGELVRDTENISAETHIRSILQQVLAHLDIELESLSPSGNAWQEQVRRFLEKVRSRGYTAVHVLVDNVYGYAETQADPEIATLLLRHLVGSYDLLDTANLCSGFYTADLSFRFFLPLSLKERLLQYGGFRTGRIKIVDMVWEENLLQKVLKARLQAASSPRTQVDSLMAFTNERWPMNLDSFLIGLAQGSPRRLIGMVNMLFQHRAQIWHESGRSPEELYITMADWATLLEHLVKHGSVK